MTSKLISVALVALAFASGCYQASGLESPVDRAPRGSADRAELDLPADPSRRPHDWERETRSVFALFESERTAGFRR